jgi:hypothetical protein
LATKNYNRALSTKIVSARQEFRAARQRILTKAADLASCRNPLGISEQDLPLFFGDASGASGRYFASSDYLLGLASPAISQATLALDAARRAWDQARQTRIQAQATAQEHARRVEELQLRYGNEIIDACGLQMDPQTVLAAFDPATPNHLTVDTCHLKPGCTADSQDPTCFSGTIGEAVVTIKAAKQDVDIARKQLGDLNDGYDLQVSYCTQLSDTLKNDLDFAAAHEATMKQLRKQKEDADIAAIALDAATQCAGGAEPPPAPPSPRALAPTTPNRWRTPRAPTSSKCRAAATTNRSRLACTKPICGKSASTPRRCRSSAA